MLIKAIVRNSSCPTLKIHHMYPWFTVTIIMYSLYNDEILNTTELHAGFMQLSNTHLTLANK